MNKTNVPEKALEVLQEIGLPMEKAMWNCHGTWVMYHKACEQIAAHKKTHSVASWTQPRVTKVHH